MIAASAGRLLAHSAVADEDADRMRRQGCYGLAQLRERDASILWARAIAQIDDENCRSFAIKPAISLAEHAGV